MVDNAVLDRKQLERLARKIAENEAKAEGKSTRKDLSQQGRRL
jgi:hypothetical protein